MESDAKTASETDFCSFFLDDRLYGVPLSAVREIIKAKSLTRVPNARNHIAGLINVRGDILVVLDARAALGLQPQPFREDQPCVVVREGDIVACVLCDRICDIVRVNPNNYEATPSTVSEAQRKLVPGAFKLQNAGLLMRLELDQLVTPSTPEEPVRSQLH